MDEITEHGCVALTDAKAKVKELFRELIEEHGCSEGDR
jgi:hypothetical protein